MRKLSDVFRDPKKLKFITLFATLLFIAICIVFVIRESGNSSGRAEIIAAGIGAIVSFLTLLVSFVLDDLREQISTDRIEEREKRKAELAHELERFRREIAAKLQLEAERRQRGIKFLETLMRCQQKFVLLLKRGGESTLDKMLEELSFALALRMNLRTDADAYYTISRVERITLRQFELYDRYLGEIVLLLRHPNSSPPIEDEAGEEAQLKRILGDLEVAYSRLREEVLDFVDPSSETAELEPSSAH